MIVYGLYILALYIKKFIIKIYLHYYNVSRSQTLLMKASTFKFFFFPLYHCYSLIYPSVFYINYNLMTESDT